MTDCYTLCTTDLRKAMEESMAANARIERITKQLESLRAGRAVAGTPPFNVRYNDEELDIDCMCTDGGSERYN